MDTVQQRCCRMCGGYMWLGGAAHRYMRVSQASSPGGEEEDARQCRMQSMVWPGAGRSTGVGEAADSRPCEAWCTRIHGAVTRKTEVE